MQEFAPDATTTPAGYVHQHRCRKENKITKNTNFFFEHQIFVLDPLFFDPQSLLQSFAVTPKY